MIVTACPHCDEPQMYTANMGQFGVYALHTCEECESEYVVEVTRTDGTTYTKSHFESEVLPEIDEFERCVHPDDDSTVLYCNPDKLRWADT